MMLGFMDYVQNTFYEASHWNSDNSYGSLEDTPRSNFLYPLPPPFFYNFFLILNLFIYPLFLSKKIHKLTINPSSPFLFPSIRPSRFPYPSWAPTKCLLPLIPQFCNFIQTRQYRPHQRLPILSLHLPSSLHSRREIKSHPPPNPGARVPAATLLAPPGPAVVVGNLASGEEGR